MIVVTFIVALLLTVLPLPEWARMYRPQWYTLVLIYWTMASPQRVGVGIGWLTGIIVDTNDVRDVLSSHAIGQRQCLGRTEAISDGSDLLQRHRRAHAASGGQ